MIPTPNPPTVAGLPPQVVDQMAREAMEEARKLAKRNRHANRYAEFQRDPVRFCREVLEAEFTKPIEDMIQSVVDNRITIVKSSNAVGKTHSAARVALWFYMVYPDAQVYTTSAPPVENLKSLLWGEILSVFYKKPKLFHNHKVTTLNIERHPTSFMKGVAIPMTGSETDREAKFSGKHAPHLLFIVDEGDAVPEEVYKGIESCMSGGHTRLLILFNPRDKNGSVYQKESQGQGKVVTLSALDHPNVVTGRDIIPGAVDRETTVRRINEWTREAAPDEQITDEFFEVPQFLVGVVAMGSDGRPYPPLQAGFRRVVQQEFWYMVLGRYPAQSEHQLIAEEWVLKARQRYDLWVKDHGETSYGQPTMGVDVADLGADNNAVCFRYGNFVAPMKTWSGLDLPTTSLKCLELYREKKAERALVDGDGIGAGLAPLIRRDGKREGLNDIVSIGVQVSEKPLSFIKAEFGEFYQLRDQLWWACREWLRTDQAMLPPDPELIEELLVARYSAPDPHRKIKIMKKDDMRKILKRSPDKADALVMTFAPFRAAKVRRLSE